jgi:hypothetical protein
LLNIFCWYIIKKKKLKPKFISFSQGKEEKSNGGQKKIKSSARKRRNNYFSRGAVKVGGSSLRH